MVYGTADPTKYLSTTVTNINTVINSRNTTPIVTVALWTKPIDLPKSLIFDPSSPNRKRKHREDGIANLSEGDYAVFS